MTLPSKYKSVEKIQNLLETDFEAKLYNSACQSLCESTNDLRFNNFAYGIRELILHILDRLSPNKLVVQCAWYAKDPNFEVTRSQKIKYAIQKGLSDPYVTYLDIDIDYYDSLVKDAIGKLNKFTHVNSKSFGISDDEVIILVEGLSMAFENFSKAIKDCNKKLMHEIGKHIDKAFIKHLLSDSIEEIKELSTHQTIEDISPDKYLLSDINDHSISVNVSGEISVELQYGSNSDNRNGDGFKMDEQYPFKSELFIDLNSFPNYECDIKSFKVDTSSFYK